MAVEDKGLEYGDWIELLPLGGMEDGEIDGECMSALVRTVAEDDFPEDDGLAEGLFGMVIGRGHVIDEQEREEAVVVAFRIKESLAEVFGLGMSHGFGAQGVQLVVKSGDVGLGGLKRDFLGVALPSEIAGVGEKPADVIAKCNGIVVGLVGWQHGDEFGNVPCFADEMCQT